MVHYVYLMTFGWKLVVSNEVSYNDDIKSESTVLYWLAISLKGHTVPHNFSMALVEDGWDNNIFVSWMLYTTLL